MPTEAAHLAAANRTQKTIDYLLEDAEPHSPWIATTAFYKALHIVEAVFANDRDIRHTSNHDERARCIKSVQKYRKIADCFLPLSRASLIARYLSSYDCFDDYMSPKLVQEKLLRHYLHQIEKSARKFLSNPTGLDTISSALKK